MNDRLRRITPWVALVVAILVVVGFIAIPTVGSGPTKTIMARFSGAPGLYAGNHVEVLGIPEGVITSIKPEPGYVLVTMKVNAKLPIPANADAILMAPQVVADRFIQLVPAYTSGTTMSAGSTIPLERTAIPESVDAVIGTLNTLARQLGPNGINKNGALTDLVHRLAVQFGGTGTDFHSAVVNFSGALAGLAQNSQAVGGTLTNLGQLSQALADHSTSYQAFSASLDAVAKDLADNRAEVGAVLSSLQQLFANLTTFIRTNKQNLQGSIANLDQFATTLAKEQYQLAQLYSVAPLSLQNLDNAVDKSAPGGPALVGRYDPVQSTKTLFNTVCGSTALRFLVILATGTQTNPLTPATPTDTLCGIGNALAALTLPPGASPGPDLSLKALASG